MQKDMAAVFETYIADRRQQELEGLRREDLGELIRYTAIKPGEEGMVAYAQLSEEAQAERAIQDQINYFRSRGECFEWKLYDLDQPPTLGQMLKDHGFVADEVEALMVFDLQSWPAQSQARRSSSDWTLKNIVSPQGVRDVLSVQEQVWSQSFDWLGDRLLMGLSMQPEQRSIFCAYDLEGRPIGTGWTDYPAGSDIPELHGGSVLAGWRGRGVYSQLYRQRLHEAASRGYQSVAVDAAPMSRPILERLGFAFVCNTTPMRYKISQPPSP